MKRLTKLSILLIAAFVVTLCLFAFPTKANAATEGYYSYIIYNNKSYIRYVDNAIRGDVTIPATLGGYNVVGILDGAFRGCHNLTRVTIPYKVITIDDYAFEGCTNLTSVAMGNRVTSLGEGAFSGCLKLNDITIPNSVLSIGSYAFLHCRSLKSITIPDSVTSIGTHVFNDCTSLRSIHVDSNNPIYCSEYGVLFNKNKSSLIQAPPAGIIGDYVIPGSVTYIADWAFTYCDHLTSITIPSSVASILECTFNGCTSLREVTYCGTEDQWNEIVISAYGNNALTSAVRYYHSWQDVTCIVAKTCTICGATEGKPLGHFWKMATCTIPKTCTTCGTTEGQPLGHDWQEATCMNAKTCISCGLIEGNVLDHSGIWIDLLAATCTQDGLSARICSGCGITESQVIPALGHRGNSVITEATCTMEGYTTTECTTCGETVISNTVPALGHNNTSIVTEPTCLEQGYTTNTCTVCGTVAITDYVAAMGHGWSAWIQVNLSSCTTEGSQLRFCNCGARETETLPKLPHSYTDGICEICKQPLGGDVILSADMTVSGLNLVENLYIDLNGYNLSGTIVTNGYKVYGMDSTTNDYTCDTMGCFSCVDENGNAIVPESLYTYADDKRYMTIETENGHTFHRFYLGITNVSIAPSVTGFGYKAEFYGDEMVQSQIASVGYNLWLNEGHVISKTTGFKNSLTLRLKNFDVANYGNVSVNACVTITLIDGTIITGATHSNTLQQAVETVNANFASYTESQLAAVRSMIIANPTMQTWQVENIYKKESQ